MFLNFKSLLQTVAEFGLEDCHHLRAVARRAFRAQVSACYWKAAGRVASGNQISDPEMG